MSSTAGSVSEPPPGGAAAAPFRARAPWWGGDLQTVRNTLLRDYADLSPWPGERLAFVMPDGSEDRLLATLNRPDGDVAPRPLVLLVHGLTGCEGSAYMLASAAALLDAGHPVLRLNLRGAGPSRAVSRGFTHAGRSDDLAAVLAQLPADLTQQGVVAVGYSLGGNILLKYLAEAGEASGLVAAASISAPIDLAATADRFEARRNTIYHRWLLKRMKFEAMEPPAELTLDERLAIIEAPTVRAFDDGFVAPRHGFADAADYYRRCSAAAMLGAIRVPTLAIHAGNDPWIPVASYRQVDWVAAPSLTPVIAAGGGHVGFHDRGGPPAWHDRCLLRFFTVH